MDHSTEGDSGKEEEDDDYYSYDDDNYLYEYPDDSSESLSQEDLVHPELLYEDKYANHNSPHNRQQGRRKVEEGNEVYPKDSPYTAAAPPTGLAQDISKILLLLALATAGARAL